MYTTKYLVAAFLLGVLSVTTLSLINNSEQPETVSSTPKTAIPTYNANQSISPLPLPQTLKLAGETVPLSDYDVRERLDREILVNTYWHSKTIHMYKLSQRYFPIIEPILAAHGVPDDFKYLALAESGLLNVNSSAGAHGPWQILKATGQEYGLEVAQEVDERYHLEKSTIAACEYLTKAKKQLGNWTLAAAAYNAGVYAIKEQLSKQQVDNYYDLYLTTETSRYVFRILAIKDIHMNFSQYGFHINPTDNYLPLATREVTAQEIADIPSFAIQNGTTYKHLKLLNPWLRRSTLERRRNGKVYTIKLPA